ncbi:MULTISPECIES: energy-dependent translational throttle protein EttA [Mycobacteriaceae]|jgi:ATP-binding cassette ChvD family protein|uniref:Energy-dependent translational throttle protein EttA n=2 Tax=Mycolicibacterium TaxID=1866885 RepID=A0A7I7ZLH7_9MYCO|nr:MULTISPECIES: energy-dependent translational throttle protein EttA [Mycolicibacterium]SHW00021.1 ATP-binding cassette protein, ChvD family [Mycobacteroides abscessus subsp. abscessus]MCX8557416.1 energy-dependent translational throttle protein EttA [Mycolicibacterium mucogenicum]OBA82295.1 energy-dependent translational throttle protein EttA [Mycolicibacterium mucogenicum]RUP34512.1 MAG: energy-dependent translational throttle protein EttA [Mycolicibacterium sp.]TLH72018.1 energy-dependent 
MAEFIYTMRKVRKAHGDKVILDDVTLNFLPGAKIGVVGPNGAGKSSVLKIMAGIDKANNGDAFLAPGATVGILMQEPELDETKTVRENVEAGVAVKAKLNRYNEVAELMATDYTDELMEEMGKLQEELDAADAWDIDSQLEQAMDALRCPPPDEPVTHLSGGERRRVALCKLLLSKPDLLLLDEPTNHLDAESVNWLEQHLADYKGAILAVTHDRYFLDNVAEWILELDRGRAYPYEGNYSTYLEKKAERLEVQGKKDQKLQKRLKDELAWVRSGAKARQAKNKARLGRYEEMVAEAEKTRKLDFEEIQIPTPPRLGNVVVEVDNLKKGFDDRVLIENLSFTLPRNGIVGVIGPNGVGKSTLFKTIVGLEQPDGGTVKVGETVKLSYVDQSRAGIDPKKTVWEVVSDKLDYIEVGQNEIPSRAYVSAFGFKGPDQQKPAGVLSGGERNRLNLALTLKEGGNLILLDEPTNDLDVETLSSLENALEQFPGCAVVISHDRWFLDRTCTHILAWEGDDEDEAKWFWFEGNFGAYEENKVERLGIEAARPHRVTHRKLTRD